MKRLSRLVPAVALSLAAGFANAADRTVFRDDFSDSGSGWIDTQVADHKAKGIALYNNDGGYQMTPVDDATYGIVPAPRQAPGADVQVDLRQVQRRFHVLAAGRVRDRADAPEVPRGRLVAAGQHPASRG